jgi:hypothetical protein
MASDDFHLVELVHDRFGWVDAERRIAHTEGGEAIVYYLGPYLDECDRTAVAAR